MSDELDRLLWYPESESLDFKEQQYPLSLPKPEPGQDAAEVRRRYEAKRSELLKDILAMANAWRDGESDAHILVGVRDAKTPPAVVVGLPAEQYGDDANFQEFIGSKVKPTLRFSYSVQKWQGKAVGVFSIRKQSERPYFSTVNFGQVKANEVYVRRGSATTAADPSEIARMGAAKVPEPAASVQLLVHRFNGTPLTEGETRIKLLSFEDLGDFTGPLPPDLLYRFHPINKDYWRELSRWAADRVRCIQVRLAVKNGSPFPLQDCLVRLQFSDDVNKPVNVIKPRNFRPKPAVVLAPNMSGAGGSYIPNDDRTLTIDSAGHCEGHIALVRPGDTVALQGSLVLMPKREGTLVVSGSILATSLSSPTQIHQQIDVAATTEKWDQEQLAIFGDSRLSNLSD